MRIPSSMPNLKGFRCPREIIAYAVWAYHRFDVSTAEAENLLAERGVIISREAVRLWVNRFGVHFATCIHRGRLCPNDKWHMDEVVIPFNGVKHWLLRAMDANGDTLDILVQTRRSAKAARRFLAKLFAPFGQPRVVITDKLRSYSTSIRCFSIVARFLQIDHSDRVQNGLGNLFWSFRFSSGRPMSPALDRTDTKPHEIIGVTAVLSP